MRIEFSIDDTKYIWREDDLPELGGLHKLNVEDVLDEDNEDAEKRSDIILQGKTWYPVEEPSAEEITAKDEAIENEKE